MSGQCIEKLPHDKCGSSDGLQVWVDDRDRYSGYCFVCDSYVADPYGGAIPVHKPKLKKSKEEIEQS